MRQYLLILGVITGLLLIVFGQSGSISFMIWYLFVLAILRGANYLECIIILNKKYYNTLLILLSLVTIGLLILIINNTYSSLINISFDKLVSILALIFLLFGEKNK
jgi:hypothetical protein